MFVGVVALLYQYHLLKTECHNSHKYSPLFDYSTIIPQKSFIKLNVRVKLFANKNTGEYLLLMSVK